MAVSWAEVLGAEKVYIGAVEPDSSGYPDCRPAYYKAFNEVVKAGTKDGRIEIVTPLIAMRKAEIVRLGLELGAPFDLTWSCYSREDRACGVCDSCVLRLRAFHSAGVAGSDSLRGEIVLLMVRQREEFEPAMAPKIHFDEISFAGRQTMKKHFAFIRYLVLTLGLSSSIVFAQAAGTVKGVCKDPKVNRSLAAWLSSTISITVRSTTSRRTTRVNIFRSESRRENTKSSCTRLPRIKSRQGALSHQRLPGATGREQPGLRPEKGSRSAAKGAGLTPEELKATTGAGGEAAERNQHRQDAARRNWMRPTPRFRRRTIDTAITNLTKRTRSIPPATSSGIKLGRRLSPVGANADRYRGKTETL